MMGKKKVLAIASIIGLALLFAGLGMTFNAAVVAAPGPAPGGIGSGNGSMVLSLDGPQGDGTQDGADTNGNEASGPSGNHIYFPKNFNLTGGHGHRSGPSYSFQDSGLPETEDNGTVIEENETNDDEEEEEEICAGNCDGEIIEDLCIGFESSETSCGIGACAASGYTSCLEGQVTDSCVPLLASYEVCSDGIDNDCDGAADCADESDCVRDDACVEDTTPAPEFMFVVIPIGIIALMLAFSYRAAKENQ